MNKIHKAADDRRWWCGGGKQRTRYHLFTKCRAWLPQTRRMWKAHRWRHPRAPAIKWLWREESTEAALEVLRETRLRR